MNRRSKIYLLALIWAAVLIQLFINSSVNREKKMVTQVMSQGVENLSEGSVRAYAFYGEEELGVGAKEVMVKNLAKSLGIVSGYEINHRKDKDNETTELSKQGKQGDTTIRLISIAVADDYGQQIWENYVLIDIELKGSAGQAVYDYKEKLVKLCDDLGMRANTNIYICTQKKGKMIDTEIETEVNDFIKSMDATEVKRIELEDGICVYAYSSGINEYVYQDGEKVNVNIAITYDKTEDLTLIHKAIPFVDKSF
ncbi:MAG: YwmB family TATA-box binding protein [Lachnospiraceae bacterium]|nr:YwmB family TATA-box binding protein [Lachnospiraceae bacterium]